MALNVSIRHRLGDFSLDTDFSIQKPGVTALFGPSGSGKTTVVRAIAGLLRPDSGSIRIADETVFDRGDRTWVPPTRRGVGYVFQDARLFPHLDVRRNLLFGESRAGSRPPGAGLDDVVSMLGIADLLDRQTASLSGGERQRVALGRALLSRPRVLLLDEPLAGLDQERKNEIIPFLAQLRDATRIPVVYVSHSLDEVARLADDIVLLREGRVERTGSVFEVLSGLDTSAGTEWEDPGAVIQAVVAEHDAAEQMTRLTFDAGTLWVGRIERPEGSLIRIRIKAHDVMLATTEPQHISANNVIRATVSALRMREGSGVDVQLVCGQTRLLSRITRKSCTRLSIEPGLELYAVIKSVAVDRSRRNR